MFITVNCQLDPLIIHTFQSGFGMLTGTDGCIRVDSRTSEAVNSVQELVDFHMENAEQTLWFVLRPCSSSLFFCFILLHFVFSRSLQTWLFASTSHELCYLNLSLLKFPNFLLLQTIQIQMH